MHKLAEKREGRQVRATGDSKWRCNKHVSSSFNGVIVSLNLVVDAVTETMPASTGEDVKGYAAPDGRRGDGRSWWLDRAVLHDVYEAINSSIVFLAVHALLCGPHGFLFTPFDHFCTRNPVGYWSATE